MEKVTHKYINEHGQACEITGTPAEIDQHLNPQVTTAAPAKPLSKKEQKAADATAAAATAAKINRFTDWAHNTFGEAEVREEVLDAYEQTGEFPAAFVEQDEIA